MGQEVFSGSTFPPTHTDILEFTDVRVIGTRWILLSLKSRDYRTHPYVIHIHKTHIALVHTSDTVTTIADVSVEAKSSKTLILAAVRAGSRRHRQLRLPTATASVCHSCRMAHT